MARQAVETVENFAPSAPSASRTIITPNDAMACLMQSLKSKSIDSPSAITKVVRKFWPKLKVFHQEHPGHLRELVRQVDYLERGRSAAWYSSMLRAILEDLAQQARAGRALSSRPAGPSDHRPAEVERQVMHRPDPTSIRQGVFDFMNTLQTIKA